MALSPLAWQWNSREMIIALARGSAISRDQHIIRLLRVDQQCIDSVPVQSIDRSVREQEDGTRNSI